MRGRAFGHPPRRTLCPYRMHIVPMLTSEFGLEASASQWKSTSTKQKRRTPKPGVRATLAIRRRAADPKTGRPRYCELKKKGQQMLALEVSMGCNDL